MPSLKQSLPRILASIAIVAAVAASAIALSRPAATAQQPDALTEAMRAYVEQRGEVYAGACDQTTSPANLGQWCSKTVSQSSHEAEVMFGPTFSEYAVTVTFANENGPWQPVAEEPVDMTPGATPHYVTPGETLESIAQRFGVSVEAILEFNGISDPAVVQPDTTILIPDANQSAAPPCAEGDGFRNEGELAAVDGSDNPDATTVLDLAFTAGEGCDRFVVALGTEEGRPADNVGEVRAEYLGDLGIIRIELDDHFSLDDFAGAPADMAFDSSLIAAAYVIWSADQRPYVDIHLQQAVEARIEVTELPATVVLDVRPADGEAPTPAVSGTNVVVVEPQSEAEFSYPLTVRGYARTFESNVIARIYVDGEMQEEEFTTATSWLDLWGEFEITLDDGPSGNIELFVGEESAADGSEIGVRIPLVMD